MDLEGKVALVTGASEGIGAAVAGRLHEQGPSVGLLSRNGEGLGLERALGLAGDVRDRAAVATAVEAIVEVTRPQGMRILATSFRPMSEPSRS